MKTNSKTIRLLVWQPASAGKGSEMSEMQAHHCMTKNSEAGSCALRASAVNKLLLQEINQLITIGLLTPSFLETFGSYSQFPGRGKCPF